MSGGETEESGKKGSTKGGESALTRCLAAKLRNYVAKSRPQAHFIPT